MLAYFFNSGTLTPTLKARVAPLVEEGQRLYLFSNKSRSAFFPLNEGEIGSAFQPLKSGLFDRVLVDPSCDFFASTMTLDWLSNIVNSAKPGAEVRLPRLKFEDAKARNRVDETVFRELLGPPRSESASWLVFSRPETNLPVNRSILGGFLQARGEFVLNAVFGGATNNANTNRVCDFFAPILAPDAPPPEPFLRLPRDIHVDIVNRVRAGELGRGVLAEIPPASEPAPWSYTESAAHLNRHLNSWQNYLMQGTYYKAATLARIIKDRFGSDRTISFLEHGGYAGTLSMQLLLEDHINIEYARCCEVEQFTLLNAFEMRERLARNIQDRFHMQITSAETAVYTREYDVIMFSHVLLYLRRDMLDQILANAWKHIRPGGILVVFENTAPPTGLGGSDDDIIFGPEELDTYFDALGEISYAEARTGAPADREQRRKKSLFRIIRK